MVDYIAFTLGIVLPVILLIFAICLFYFWIKHIDFL